MKLRLFGALAALFAFVGIAQGAGTVPGFSLTPQFDLTGKVMPGCKLYVIQAGTVSTPQNPYQDSGLTLLQPNPLTCDAAGRLPAFFVADGNIKLRLTTSAGVQVFVGDQLLVIGASSGGGGGSPVDPTTILTTGDIKAVYGTGIVTGFVRLNGRTIGSATSGATERANSDVQALFVYLWGADANLAVSGGRGLTAAADWAANKTIALPDFRGRVPAGLDDMGNSAASRLTSTYFGSAATTLGVTGGGESQTLTLAQAPTGITATGTFSLSASGLMTNLNNELTAFSTNAGGANQWLAWTTTTTHTLANPTASGTVTSNNTSGAAHPIVQPTILITWYQKL
jgi:hypothetical protein